MPTFSSNLNTERKSYNSLKEGEKKREELARMLFIFPDEWVYLKELIPELANCKFVAFIKSALKSFNQPLTISPTSISFLLLLSNFFRTLSEKKRNAIVKVLGESLHLRISEVVKHIDKVYILKNYYLNSVEKLRKYARHLNRKAISFEYALDIPYLLNYK